MKTINSSTLKNFKSIGEKTEGKSINNFDPFKIRKFITEAALVRAQLKCDGTRWRTGGEVKGKLANAVGSQYSRVEFKCDGTR